MQVEFRCDCLRDDFAKLPTVVQHDELVVELSREAGAGGPLAYSGEPF